MFRVETFRPTSSTLHALPSDSEFICIQLDI